MVQFPAALNARSLELARQTQGTNVNSNLQNIFGALGGDIRQKQEEERKFQDEVDLFQKQQEIKSQFRSPLEDFLERVDVAKGLDLTLPQLNQLMGQTERQPSFRSPQNLQPTVQPQPQITQQAQQQLPVGGMMSLLSNKVGDIEGNEIVPQAQPANAGQNILKSFGGGVKQVGDRTFQAQKFRTGAIGQDIFEDFKLVPSQKDIDEERINKFLTKGGEKGIETAAAIAKSTQQEIVETRKKFLRVQSLFKTLAGQIAAKRESQGGRLGKIPHLLGEFGRFRESLGLSVLTGEEPKEERFSRIVGVPAQRFEVAFGLNPILSGQNRVIKSALNMILKTIPSGTDSEGQTATLLAQSITNSFKLLLATEQNLFTRQDALQLNEGDDEKSEGNRTARLQGILDSVQMSKGQEDILEEIIVDILSTPAAPKLMFGKEFEDFNIKSLDKDEITLQEPKGELKASASSPSVLSSGIKTGMQTGVKDSQTFSNEELFEELRRRGRIQ